jgi:hypothetical protein
MSKFAKCLMLMVAALVASAGTASAAPSAVAVTPSGAKTVTATSGVRFVIRSSAGSTTTVTCTGSTWNGTVSSTSGTYPLQIGRLSWANTGCRTVGLAVTARPCATTLFATAGTFVTGATPLALTGISCDLALTSNLTCRTTITGSLANASFSNGTDLMNVIASPSSQSLTGGPSTCTSTFVDGTVNFSSTIGGDVRYGFSPITTIDATP